jgi:hypothetical protein
MLKKCAGIVLILFVRPCNVKSLLLRSSQVRAVLCLRNESSSSDMNWLKSAKRSFSCLNSFQTGAGSPLKRLVDKKTLSKSCSFTMDGGSEPVKLLWCTSSVFSSDNWPTQLGSDPRNTFSPTSKFVSRVRAQIAVGIPPSNRLLLQSMVCSHVKRPISVGISPLALLRSTGKRKKATRVSEFRG